jgi:hypothetical protein
MSARRSRRGRACRFASGIVAVLALAGCMAPTPYKAADDGFGYAQQQIEQNRYRVSFSGNALTLRSTVQNYLLYRAAEVTVDSGHDYFIVVDDNLERSTRYHGTVNPWFPGGYRRHGDPFYDPYPATLNAYPIDEYTAFADIQVFRGDKPANNPGAYDARDVLNHLAPTIVREAPEGATP